MTRRWAALALAICLVLSMPMAHAEEDDRIKNPISFEQFEERFITAMEYFCLEGNIPVHGGTIRAVGGLDGGKYKRFICGARTGKDQTSIGILSLALPKMSAIDKGMLFITKDEKDSESASAFSMAFLYGVSTHKDLQTFIQEFIDVYFNTKEWPHVSGYYTWDHGTGESLGLGEDFSEYIASQYTGFPIAADEFVLDEKAASETHDLIASFSEGSYLCGNPDGEFSPLYGGTYKATAYSSATLRIRRNGNIVFSNTMTRKNPAFNVKIQSGDEILVSGGDVLLSRTATKKFGASVLNPSSNSSFRIQAVQSLGDGRVEVIISDPQNKGPYTVNFVRKATNNFEKDQTAQGFHWIHNEIKSKAQIINDFVPGESYWVWASNSAGEETERYVFSAPAVKQFDGFKTKPSISSFNLKSRALGSSAKDIDAFKASAIYSSKNIEYGAYVRYDYPQLKNPRTYFQQMVFRAPNGFCAVDYADDDELPSGDTYSYWTFYSFEKFFAALTHGGRMPPTGTYRFEFYWDGMLVDFKTFQVK